LFFQQQMEQVEDSHLSRPERLALAPPALDAAPIIKESLPAPIYGFLLHNVLSKNECEWYINQTEGFGYESLTGYKSEYRNNTRIVLMSDELSALIYERIKEFVPTEVLVETDSAMKMTSEFGTEGLWHPYGLNHCWRFCKYQPGGHFSPHFDGYYAKSATDRSLYTFMLYLNGGFDGGETNFIRSVSDATPHKIDGEIAKVIAKVKPEAGLALIFLHPFLHEGSQLKSNVKYILRSEIMFKQEPTHQSFADEKDVEALRLFRLAASMEEESPFAAAELYRKAFKMSKKLKDAYKG